MRKTGPTQLEVDNLVDAMVHVCNDLAFGNTVCGVVKARARIALEPFLLEDNGELQDLEEAQRVIKEIEDGQRL